MRSFLVLTLLACCGTAQPPAKAAEKAGYTDPQLIAGFQNTSPTRVADRRRLAKLMSVRTSAMMRDFMLRAVARDRDAGVRRSMLKGLVRTPDKQVAEKLDQLLARPGISVGEKRYILQSLPKFKSLKWRSRLARFVVESNNAALRGTAISVIAKGRDDRSLSMLRRIKERDPEQAQAVLGALRSAKFPIRDVFRDFIAPHLLSKPSGVRMEAVRCLAHGKDRRFHKFARLFTEDETNSYYLNPLITDAALFDDVQGVTTMILLAQRGGVGTAVTLEKALAKIKGDEIQTWLVTRGLAHPTDHIRRAVLKTIAKRPDVRAIKPLTSIAKGPDTVDAIQALRTLGSIGGPDVIKHLRARWGARDPFVAAAALESSYLAEKGSPDVVAALTKVAHRSRAWRMRLVAIQVLKTLHAPAMFEQLKINAAHKRGQLRAECYDALTHVRTKDCVDFLIARLFHEKGRSRFDLADALLDLTGFDYGVSARTWRDWWGRVRDGYPLPPKPKKRRRSAPPAGYASYYGIPVRSHRVAFVIDTSGSMQPIAGTGKKSKMQLAQENLINTVNALGPKVGFTIVAFATGNNVFEEELILASRVNKARSKLWVLDLKPNGGTMLMGALTAALAVDKVDTLFVLSDGAPNGSTSEILRIITERNRFDRVRINTIGIQVSGSTARFMRDLAEKNFGEFVAR